MITDYHCRHCKSKCPPFRYLDLFDMYVTECEKCEADYRIVNPVPIIYLFKGFDDVESITPLFFRHGITEFTDPPPCLNDADDTELEKLAFLLWEAEQSENYELCAKLRDKIKQLEK